jgi:hypothetical protein
MKRLTCIFAIVLGLATFTTASVVGYSNAASVTAAGTGLFETGATLSGVALQGVRLGTGVFIEADGSASGTFHAVLQGRALGVSRELTVEGKVDAGTVSADGRATFSGTASFDFGDGTPPLPAVTFSVIAGTDGLVLAIDSTTLPATALTTGAITIE